MKWLIRDTLVQLPSLNIGHVRQLFAMCCVKAINSKGFLFAHVESVPYRKNSTSQTKPSRTPYWNHSHNTLIVFDQQQKTFGTNTHFIGDSTRLPVPTLALPAARMLPGL